MTRVTLSRRAEAELRAIRRTITRASGPRTALKWVTRLRDSALSLSDAPTRGALDPELGRRRLVVRPYLIFYDIRSGDSVVIVSIVDGRRDLDSLLGKSERD